MGIQCVDSDDFQNIEYIDTVQIKEITHGTFSPYKLNSLLHRKTYTLYDSWIYNYLSEADPGFEVGGGGRT